MEYAEKRKSFSDRYWIKRNRYYYSRLASFYRFAIPEGGKVLQVGCRSGFLLNEVKPSYGVGIDKDVSLIEEASGYYPDMNFICGSIEDLDESVKFDYVILSHTLMREYDIQLFLERLKKYCHRDTRIVINICSDIWELLLKLGQKIGLRRNEPFINWLQLTDLENLLSLAGLEVISKDYRTLFPKYIPLVSSIFNQFLGNLPIIRRLCLDQFIIAKLPSKFKSEELSVSVVVPCRNEKGNIEAAVQRMPKMGNLTEIIFVEGGSQDGTWEEVQRVVNSNKIRDGFSVKCFQQEGRGKGDAVRKGYDNSTGNVLMILDADLTVPPEELIKFFNAIKDGKGNFINGVRLLYSMESRAMRFLNLIANKIFSMGFSYMLNQRIRDTLCGTKVLLRKDWNKIEASRDYFGDFDPFGDFDLIFGAVKNNLKIIDMPIHYKDRSYGSTQISRFRHGVILLRMCIFAFQKFKMK